MKKRISKILFSILLTISLFGNAVVYAADDVKNEEIDTIEMVTTDFRTGESVVDTIQVSNSQSVLEAEASIKMRQPRLIIGEDERTEVPDFLMSYVPYSTIGIVTAYHEDGRTSRGTGFLIGPDDVATAAHVIIGDDVEFFTFSFPGESDVYWTNIMSVPQEYYDTEDITYDWAVFEIDEEIGYTRGYCGWTTDIHVNDTVQVIGYPGDKSSGLWMAGKQVQQLYDRVMTYDADATFGQSGAPVIKAGTTGICAGIHVAQNSTLNIGTRVTERMASIFQLCREH